VRRTEVTGDEPVETLLPIADMAEARLVLTDELVREALRRSKAEAEARERLESEDHRTQAAAPHARANEGD
jgi:ribosome maturation factor RimP